MKTVSSPNTYLYWKGLLHKVIGFSEGKTIHMVPVFQKPCATCGVIPEVSVLESSPLFQDETEPVETIKET